MILGRWMTSCPEAWAEDFGIWEKAVSWVPASEQESRDSELGETRWICALRVPRVGWVESWRCKSSQHRKIVSLSLSCRITFNSKVIKSFVPEPISRAFRFPMSISHIRIPGYVTVSTFELQLRYYIHFRANTIGKCMNSLILPAMG